MSVNAVIELVCIAAILCIRVWKAVGSVLGETTWLF
jgi:hypothetical protein